MTLNQFICYKPGPRQRGLIIAVAWLFVILIGIAHYASGPRVALYAFYLAPILAVTWFVGPRWGMATALLSTANWLVVDIGLMPHWQAEFIVFINESLRFGMYLLLVIMSWQWRKALDRESTLARVDSLTQMPNRRAFFELARIELERARRHGHPLTAIMLDLDNFKAVNDEQGHQAGDELLRAFSNVLLHETRSYDVVGRLGGDEFALVLPETGVPAAMAFSEKLRREVLAAMKKGKWPVTVSLGVATFNKVPQNVDQLLNRADRLMYDVKQAGKNQIRHELIDMPEQ